MRTRLRENPECQDSAGGFDRNRFARLLQLSNLSEQAYLARLGADIKRQQLVGAATEAAVAPASLAERLFVYRAERRVSDYVSLPTDRFTVSVEPDGPVLPEIYDAALGRLSSRAAMCADLAFPGVSLSFHKHNNKVTN